MTELEYFAWPKGPVPVELFDELNDPGDDMSAAMTISERSAAQGKKMLNITPRDEFSPDAFTKRELKILEDLAGEYENSYADKMVEATHLENLPWHQTYEVEGKKQSSIPYDLSIKKSEEDELLKNSTEHRDFKRNYG